MSKQVILTGTELGGALSTLSIYHTSITGSNLVTSSITPQQLLDGLPVILPDNTTEVIIQCDSGECFEKTGSLTISPYVQSTRWFTVNAGAGGTVSVIAPVSAGPSSTFISQSVNFNNFNQFVISGDTTYPLSFTGWYDAPTGGSLISTSSPLTITLNDYPSTDDFYARFS